MNRMENKLILGQGQLLNLNQRLTQSLEILSLSYDELLDVIKKEAEENPVLSLDSAVIRQTEYLNVRKVKSSSESVDEDMDYLDTIIEDELQAVDMIKEELRYLPLNPKELEIAKTLSDNLDEAGYINKSDLPLIAKNLDTSLDTIERVLKELRKLDPPGLFAFNLKDGLLIQLRRLKHRNLLAEKILLSCLNFLLKDNLNAIALKLNVERKEVLEALSLIKTLNPRPMGLIHSRTEINYVTADLKLYFDETGRPRLIVDEGLVSSMHYEPYYLNLITTKDSDEETLSYVKNQFSRLKLIRRAIEKRAFTLHRVAEFIFEKQRGYFSDEDGGLQVLTLKMIAEALKLSESTISRTLRNKYVDTPLGLFELKYFLQKGVRNKRDESISKLKIKTLLKKMIDEEDASKPYSDKDLALHFSLQNIDLSRRVICKYREELGIPPSSKRRIKKRPPAKEAGS